MRASVVVSLAEKATHHRRAGGRSLHPGLRSKLVDSVGSEDRRPASHSELSKHDSTGYTIVQAFIGWSIYVESILSICCENHVFYLVAQRSLESRSRSLSNLRRLVRIRKIKNSSYYSLLQLRLRERNQSCKAPDSPADCCVGGPTLG